MRQQRWTPGWNPRPREVSSSSAQYTGREPQRRRLSGSPSGGRLLKQRLQDVHLAHDERANSGGITHMAQETTSNQGTPEKKPTTVQEAGRKGGRRVKEKYGQAFYVDIGKKGGRVIAETRGPEYYAAIGKKGGETVRAKHGSEFFAQIGKKGGDEVKRRHGPDYYSQIGKKGGEAPRRTDRHRTTTEV